MFFNLLIWGIIIFIVFVILTILSAFLLLSVPLLAIILLLIVFFGENIFNIVLLIFIMKDLSSAELKWYLTHEYEVVQSDGLNEENIELIKNKSYPWWVLVK